MSALIQMKEAEHKRMHAVSQSKSLIKDYLDSAPHGRRYSDLASLLA